MSKWLDASKFEPCSWGSQQQSIGRWTKDHKTQAVFMAAPVFTSSHPLSPPELPPTTKPSRRKGSVAQSIAPNGVQPASVTMPSINSYFALKSQSEERAAAHSLATGADSVNDPTVSPLPKRRELHSNVAPGTPIGQGRTIHSKTGISSPASSTVVLPGPEVAGATHSPRPQRHRPSFSLTIPPSQLTIKVATPPRTAIIQSLSEEMPTPGPSQSRLRPPSADYISNIPASAHSQIVSTEWHNRSDREIASIISQISNDQAVMSPAEESSLPHPYHSTIRVLSSALDKLNDRYLELEERWKQRDAREARAKELAEARVKALRPPIREDIARRILTAVFDVEPNQAADITIKGATPDDFVR